MLRKVAMAAGCLLALGPTAVALAEFPYPASAPPGEYDQLRLPDDAPMPNDLDGKRVWMYAATPEPNNPANADPRELGGVRGAHVVDDASNDTAWTRTTGRPDVTIAVLDSGIMWNDAGTMADIRRKTRINRGEAPPPAADRTTATEAGENCAEFAANLPGGFGGDRYDLNGDGVFNVVDYACDLAVDPDPDNGVGVPELDPQDVLIAFTNGEDEDDNGYDDDMVGWDFLDDDNDPYDDVQYGHGSGEAKGAVGEAKNANDLGTCPNCMAIHMRVGDSFVAEVNRFAQATIYAVDNDVEVVQEALGTLNNSRLATQAVEYAYDHGVTVIASAADEAAQHNNWPSSNPHVILVNSVTKYPQEDVPFPPPDGTPAPAPPAPGLSYLEFNGCTNFNSKMTLAIPSVSCSSDATERAAGMAGLVYSAALNANEAGDLDPHPTCERIGGDPCLLSANEVRQAMASGTVGTAGTEQADDVRFTGPEGTPEPRCTPTTPECTSPFESVGHLTDLRPVFPPRSYPARDGHDQFYGYGRVNARKAVEATQAGTVFPEAEIEAPDWYSFVDPDSGTLDVRGHVGARGTTYRCRVYAAPGSYPNNSIAPDGDFIEFANEHCDGTDRTAAYAGLLATVDLEMLKGAFPPDATAPPAEFKGRETGSTGNQSVNGRPNDDPYGFVVKVVVETGTGAGRLTGEDRRNLRLHHDQDLVEGFPRDIGGDGASSPALADLDGDNLNELVIAGSDGIVHAYKRNGTEIDGWPARVDRLPVHSGAPAFTSGAVTDDARAAILASAAIGDLDRDGEPEVVVADMEGGVTAFHADGTRAFTQESEIAFSGKPLEPFENVREGWTNRTQHGFIGSPVLADLDRDDGGRLEVIAAAMDRHLYAWNDDGTEVDGFPVLVVDHEHVASIEPDTHAVRFSPTIIADEKQQGAIIDTPAVGDLNGDGAPEIVVGTNEQYQADHDGGHNVSPINGFSLTFVGAAALETANTRLYALTAAGDPDGNPSTEPPQLSAAWPLKVAEFTTDHGTLPVVGEGVTGSPVIGVVNCSVNGGSGPKIGAAGHAGPAFIYNLDGTSCHGQDSNRPRPLQVDGKTGLEQTDTPVLNAFGHPVFADLGDPSGMSFFTPGLGALRALDLAFPEYQGGQDFLGGWNAQTGQPRPNFPARMNDLQFLTGPSVAEVDGVTPTQEIVSASASLDLQGFTAAGTPIDLKWPKLTSDWVVANPVIGSWGADPNKVVATATRSGFLLAYEVGAEICDGPDAWPRFHHDNWNTGDARRTGVQDTTPPGTPTGVRVEDGDLRWGAVGDDLMCEGGPVVYETATSAQPITGDTFDDARKFEAPASRAVGDQQSVALPSDVERYVAVRAADDAGNLGRTVAVDLRPPAGGGGGGTGTGTGTGGAVGGGGPVGGPGGGTTAQPPGNRPSGGGGGEASTCVPTRLLRRATVRPRGRSLGVVVPEAAAPVTVDVFQQSVGRRLGDRLVARFRARRTSFVWNGRANLRGRRVRDGYLFVRFRAGGETKRFALRRRRRGFAVRPRYYEPALCRVLASAKLLRPVFGGRSNRALSVSFHLTEQARVAIAVTRGRRVVRRFAARTYPPNRTFRLRVASRRRGDHRVRIVATAGARTDRVTLVSRRL